MFLYIIWMKSYGSVLRLHICGILTNALLLQKQDGKEHQYVTDVFNCKVDVPFHGTYRQSELFGDVGIAHVIYSAHAEDFLPLFRHILHGHYGEYLDFLCIYAVMDSIACVCIDVMPFRSLRRVFLSHCLSPYEIQDAVSGHCEYVA